MQLQRSRCKVPQAWQQDPLSHTPLESATPQCWVGKRLCERAQLLFGTTRRGERFSKSNPVNSTACPLITKSNLATNVYCSRPYLVNIGFEICGGSLTDRLLAFALKPQSLHHLIHSTYSAQIESCRAVAKSNLFAGTDVCAQQQDKYTVLT